MFSGMHPGAEVDLASRQVALCRSVVLFPHQRTFALVQRPPGFFRRNGCELLVIVPGTFALLGLLHLEEVHWVDLAPVDAMPVIFVVAARMSPRQLAQILLSPDK